MTTATMLEGCGGEAILNRVVRDDTSEKVMSELRRKKPEKEPGSICSWLRWQGLVRGREGLELRF